MRDDVLRLMDRLGMDRAVLTGHSMGAMVAYLAALAQPRRVAALVLEGRRLRCRSACGYRLARTSRWTTSGNCDR